MQWNRYKVVCKVRARLLDPTQDRVIASAVVKLDEHYEDNNDAPTYEELLADNAALLKRKLEEIAQRGVSELKEALVP